MNRRVQCLQILLVMAALAGGCFVVCIPIAKVYAIRHAPDWLRTKKMERHYKFDPETLRPTYDYVEVDHGSEAIEEVAAGLYPLCMFCIVGCVVVFILLTCCIHTC